MYITYDKYVSVCLISRKKHDIPKNPSLAPSLLTSQACKQAYRFLVMTHKQD